MIKVKRPFGYYDTALGIIGRTGENDTRTIDFDCAAALTEYPDANIICVCLRPGEHPNWLRIHREFHQQRQY